MWAEFAIAFRESFEIAVILGIGLVYFHKSRQAELAGAAVAGAFLAAAVSVGLYRFLGDLVLDAGGLKPVLEALVMLAAAALISGMVLWVMGQRIDRARIQRLAERGGKGLWAGALGFGFFTTLREGAELAVFFASISAGKAPLDLQAALAGILAALGAGSLVALSLVKLDIGQVLGVSGLLLLLIAGSLVGQAVRTLDEGGFVHAGGVLYDFNPPAADGGPYPFFHEEGIGGAALAALFGLSMRVQLGQAAAQFLYLGGMLWLVGRKAEGVKRKTGA